MRLDEKIERKWYEEVNVEKNRILKIAYEKLDTLYIKIRELTKLDDLKFTSSLNEEKCTFDFESENIADRDHLIRIAWKNMTIGNWGCWVNAGNRIKDDDYYYSGGRPDINSEVKGSGRVNVQIHYSYNHIDGGSNGAYIARATFTEKDGCQIDGTYNDLKR